MHPHDSATTRLKVAGLWGFSGGRPGWSLACGHNVDNEEMTWRLCTYSMLLSQIQKRWNILENQLLCDALCNIYYALLCSAWNLGGKVNTKEEKWSRWIISNLKWGDLGMIPLLPTLRGDIMVRLFWLSQNDGWKLKRQWMDQMELNQTFPQLRMHPTWHVRHQVLSFSMQKDALMLQCQELLESSSNQRNPSNASIRISKQRTHTHQHPTINSCHPRSTFINTLYRPVKPMSKYQKKCKHDFVLE